jgi:hypothetical protein
MNMTSEYTFRISQQGGEQLRTTLKGLGVDFTEAKTAAGGATSAIASHGKQTNTLTDFIRTQRTEQRQQNFLFREGKQSALLLSTMILGLSNSTDGADDSTKKLNKSMMMSIVTFQGADFAMAGLGIASGGTATAIAGLIALGVGLFSFLDGLNEKSKKAAEEGLKAFEEKIKEFAPIQSKKTIEEIDRDLDKLRKKLDELTNTPIGTMTIWELKKLKSPVYEAIDYYESLRKKTVEMADAQKLLGEKLLINAKILKSIPSGTSSYSLLMMGGEAGDILRKAKGTQIDLSMSKLPGYQFGGTGGAVAPALFNPEAYSQTELLKKRKEELDIELELEDNTGKRNKLLKERLSIQAKLNLMQKTDEELTSMLLDETQNAFSTMGNIIVELGGNTDNWFSKLGQVLQIMQEIKAVTEAIAVIEGILGFLGLASGEAGVSLAGDVASGLVGRTSSKFPTSVNPGGISTATREFPTSVNPGGINTATINLNIQATDVQSFEDFLSKPSNRRVITETVMRGLQGMN